MCVYIPQRTVVSILGPLWIQFRDLVDVNFWIQSGSIVDHIGSWYWIQFLDPIMGPKLDIGTKN